MQRYLLFRSASATAPVVCWSARALRHILVGQSRAAGEGLRRRCAVLAERKRLANVGFADLALDAVHMSHATRHTSHANHPLPPPHVTRSGNPPAVILVHAQPLVDLKHANICQWIRILAHFDASHVPVRVRAEVVVRDPHARHCAQRLRAGGRGRGEGEGGGGRGVGVSARAAWHTPSRAPVDQEDVVAASGELGKRTLHARLQQRLEEGGRWQGLRWAADEEHRV
jgi:hypothetical protein